MRYRAKAVGRVDVPENSRVLLDHVRLKDQDYTGRKLVQFGAVGSRLEKCLFDKVEIEDAAFGAGREVSEYVECRFNGSRVSGGGGCARFVRCSFRNVELRNWICMETEFVECVFSGRMRKCIFNGIVPEQERAWVGRDRNDIHGNDLSAMELIDVAFRTGVDLSQQKLPCGSEYLYLADPSHSLEHARHEVLAWQDSEVRRVALALINSFDDEVAHGQRQLLLRASNYYPYADSLPREVIDEVFILLRSK